GGLVDHREHDAAEHVAEVVGVLRHHDLRRLVLRFGDGTGLFRASARGCGHGRMEWREGTASRGRDVRPCLTTTGSEARRTGVAARRGGTGTETVRASSEYSAASSNARPSA